MNNKTISSSLQLTLDNWKLKLDEILLIENGKIERNQLLDKFVRSFVPKDVTVSDIEYFRDNLINDEEFLNSLQREIGQCSSGNYVESIQGNQTSKAIFTLKPLPGQLNEGNELDIVREVAFISDDNITWTAEG